jgi:hypothetical protein
MTETAGRETASDDATTRRRLCSVAARAAGEDPIGSAWATERLLLVETPLPWPADLREARALPPGLADLITIMYESQPEIGLLAIAPDRVYSRDGWTRVVDLAFPAPPRHVMRRREVLVPRDQAADLLAAWLAGAMRVPSGIAAEPQSDAGRDLLVCTHGTVDACCALFGYPLFRALRREAATMENCRVWRSTHFGGHRFAPTLLDLPEGRYWGFLTPELGTALLRHDGDPVDLRMSYRGWAGHATPEAQYLEREAFMREGWAWTTWPQAASQALARGRDGGVLTRITAFPPSEAPVAYSGWIEPARTIVTLFDTDGEPAEQPLLNARDLHRRVGPRASPEQSIAHARQDLD